MSADDEAFAQRAAARGSWAGRRTTLGDSSGGEDLSATTTMEERLAMMWELALGAWTLSGRPLPKYERRDIPGHVIRTRVP